MLGIQLITQIKNKKAGSLVPDFFNTKETAREMILLKARTLYSENTSKIWELTSSNYKSQRPRFDTSPPVACMSIVI